MNLDTPGDGFNYQALYDDIIQEMQTHYGLSKLESINYAWTVASRGVMASNNHYEKMDH